MKNVAALVKFYEPPVRDTAEVAAFSLAAVAGLTNLKTIRPNYRLIPWVGSSHFYLYPLARSLAVEASSAIAVTRYEGRLSLAYRFAYSLE